jgi:hypothetical protein
LSRSDLKILAIAGALLFGATLAFGGSSTIVVKDGNGISRTYDVVTDGSGNFVGMFGLCDGTAAAQCAAVKAASTAPASTDPAVIVAISSNTGEVGTPATGVSQPSGGVGISGWLSGIYNKLSRSICVTGTFWQATQPVSAASLPLPTGAATQTTVAAILSALGSPFQAGGSIGNTSFGAIPQPSSSSTNGLSPSTTSALAANQVVKGSAGNLYSFEVSADSTLSAAHGGSWSTTPPTRQAMGQ